MKHHCLNCGLLSQEVERLEQGLARAEEINHELATGVINAWTEERARCIAAIQSFYGLTDDEKKVAIIAIRQTG